MKLICKSRVGFVYSVKNVLYKITFTPTSIKTSSFKFIQIVISIFLGILAFNSGVYVIK